MKIASATYPLDWFETWDDYARKQREWVARAARSGADLAVFPEYGAMEMAGLSGRAMAADPQGSIDAVSGRMDQYNTLFSRLSSEFGLHILGPSAPVRLGEKTVNRATFFSPSGGFGVQDKQIMTRFERAPWNISSGDDLRLFDTALGKIGVLICYDVEFPLLAKALADAGAEIILAPSCTETAQGYWRVRIGAQARAMEQQCITVMSSLTGTQPALFGVERNTGAAGVFSPMDQGFSDDGAVAVAPHDSPGWTYADIDLAAIRQVRADGNVLNKTHWDERPANAICVQNTCLD